MTKQFLEMFLLLGRIRDLNWIKFESAPSGSTVESVNLISGDFLAGCLRAYGNANPSMNMIIITENKAGVSFSYSLLQANAYI